MIARINIIVALLLSCVVIPFLGAGPVRVGVFSIDASPPVGSPLAYDPTKEVTLPLSCRGVVLMAQGAPIVVCAVDWIGIGNESHKVFRSVLAEAAETGIERVAVHTLHQHDAPRCDFSADELLAVYGINDEAFDTPFARDVMARAAAALRTAIKQAEVITHLGLGAAQVEKVASNRRILGPDGKVKHMRFTSCRDPEIRAMPTGVIDPQLKMISFWNRGKPLVALTYYATHPQSYYRTGGANPDFPGIARNQRQEATGVMHVHFSGAGGNIGAGKWNDGSPENREVLANRVATAMAMAWQSTKTVPLSAEDVGWESLGVALPAAPNLDRQELLAVLEDETASVSSRLSAAGQLVWLERCRAGETIDLSCLRLGRARVLHMPGELFVEYQLAAQKMHPDLFVAVAAYGDYAPGYIGTEISYEQGGYETGPGVSLVAPEVEELLMGAMARLLR